MRVTFTERKCIDTWLACDENGVQVPVTYFGNPEPLLHGAQYVVAGSGTRSTIATGRRHPWSPALNRLYAPGKQCAELSKEFIKQWMVSPDARRWLTLDLDLNVKPLAPGRPWVEVVEFVQAGNFRGLVHRGGVNPMWLRRFTQDEDVLYEAVVMHMLTDLCKLHRCVWVRHDETQPLCAQFMAGDADSPTSAALVRLVRAGAVRLRRGPDHLALGWLATLLDQHRNDHPGRETDSVFCAGVAPQKASGAPVRADNSMAADHLLDQGLLPNTFTTTLWPEVAYRDFVEVHSYGCAVTHVRDWLAEKLPPTMAVFSTTGSLQFDVSGYSVLVGKKVVFVPHGGAAIPGCERLSLLPLSAIPRLVGTPVRAVIAVLDSRNDLRWVPWLRGWTGAEVLVVVVCPKPSEA